MSILALFEVFASTRSSIAHHNLHMPEVIVHDTTAVGCPHPDAHGVLEATDGSRQLCIHRGCNCRDALFRGAMIASRGAALEAAAPYAYLVAFPVPEADHVEFDEWYRTEHLDLLAAHPAWRGCQLYGGSGATGLTRLAIHHWADTSPQGSPQQAAARGTPWRARLAEREWFREGVRLLTSRVDHSDADST
jgi:hypothetical protein